MRKFSLEGNRRTFEDLYLSRYFTVQSSEMIMNDDILNYPNIKYIRSTIEKKPALRMFYEECYKKYSECLTRCVPDGLVLEIGSGGGFSKTHIQNLITSDLLPYDGVDRVIDARKLPFENSFLKAIFMLNVFHHIPDTEAFLSEAIRCLKPGGRVFICDQNPRLIGYFVLKYLHHEPFDIHAKEWKFQSSGPLSGANGALAWIVFQRDRKRFQARFPQLKLIKYHPHTPLLYWLAGGLKKWSLVSLRMIGLVKRFESVLARISPNFGSFVDIELLRLAE